MSRKNQWRLELTPAHQITVTVASGEAPCYECHGEDPQFQVGLSGGESSLGAGWYRLRARFQLEAGEIVTPCFYPDYGQGLSESTRIAIPEPDATGYVDTVVVIRGPLKQLRFDPTVQSARFRLHEFVLQRISRPVAVMRMLQGIQVVRKQLFWDDALGGCWDLLRCCLRGRMGEGATLLRERYLQARHQYTRGYEQWVELFDRYSEARWEGSRARASAYTHRPLISVVVPTHDTPPIILRKCLDSVLAQTYPNWQLCIADDASGGAVKKVLKEYQQKDARINVHLRSRHGHICETSNDAIDLAQGEFVGLLDHDDLLAPDALEQVVGALQHHPDAQIFYSDEDKIDEEGRRSQPNFKPAWSPDLLRAQNYICHFVVLKTTLLRKIGCFRLGFEGAQDHDLLLRATEIVSPSQIVHIPRILYHWRLATTSTATGLGAKPYALEAGRRAVAEHMARLGHSADVELLPSGYFTVTPRLSTALPRVTVVVPTRDRHTLLSTCMDGLLNLTAYPFVDVVVVDNGSVEPEALRLLQTLRADARVVVVEHPAPFNFSELVNIGMRAADGEIVCLLNNDVEVVDPNWLHELAVHALRADIGVVGPLLLYPHGDIQHAGVVLGIGGVAGHVHVGLPQGSNGYLGRAAVAQNLTAVTGACMVMRREVFDAVGGFDERLPVAFNDIDFCIRVANAGYRNLWTPRATLVHHESASRGLEDTPEKRARFVLEVAAMQRKWGDVLLEDPAYNPNLGVDTCHYDLAFPPRVRVPRAGREVPVRTKRTPIHLATSQTASLEISA